MTTIEQIKAGKKLDMVALGKLDISIARELFDSLKKNVVSRQRFEEGEYKNLRDALQDVGQYIDSYDYNYNNTKIKFEK